MTLDADEKKTDVRINGAASAAEQTTGLLALM